METYIILNINWGVVYPGKIWMTVELWEHLIKINQWWGTLIKTCKLKPLKLIYSFWNNFFPFKGELQSCARELNHCINQWFQLRRAAFIRLNLNKNLTVINVILVSKLLDIESNASNPNNYSGNLWKDSTISTRNFATDLHFNSINNYWKKDWNWDINVVEISS